ncbi:unnamed protein product [Bemisia tabaci]|uniref:Uncharacterized protein n=1 Tax=Bemisia tabaci TaxID=7038 RepID=A0A9P0AK51_BEMTA|nr:unnamed protein product [Bemisia tabaci]
MREELEKNFIRFDDNLRIPKNIHPFHPFAPSLRRRSPAGRPPRVSPSPPAPRPRGLKSDDEEDGLGSDVDEGDKEKLKKEKKDDIQRFISAIGEDLNDGGIVQPRFPEKIKDPRRRALKLPLPPLLGGNGGKFESNIRKNK